MRKQNSRPPKVKIGKYIDPLTDFGFKFLFGSEPNKDLLIYLIIEMNMAAHRAITGKPFMT